MNGQMNGPMNGTSIQDLHKKQRMGQYEDIRLQNQMAQMQYGTMHNSQHEGGHNSAHQVQQAQHAPYYEIDNNAGYPQYSGHMPPLQNVPSQEAESMYMSRQEMPEIDDLARDINDNLPEEPARSNNAEMPEEVEENFGNGMGLNVSNIWEVVKEPLVIVVLFTILSQPVVKDNIARYIKQLNPDNTGRVPLLGVIIYGTILATLFTLVKKFLLK